MMFDHRRLTGMGQPVGCLGVANGTQAFLESGKDRRMGWLGRQFDLFLGITVQIEQFWLEPNIADQFPAPLTQHEGAGDRPGGVVLAKDPPLRVTVTGSDRIKRLTGSVIGEINTEMGWDRYSQVQIADRRVTNGPFLPGIGDDQRDRR